MHFYVILFLLDLETNCFRYIDNASMLCTMLVDTFNAGLICRLVGQDEEVAK